MTDTLATAPPDTSASAGALRRDILDQTRRLLVSEGYEGLSMRKIARAVGCSATSIYLYFESKDALTHALIDEGMDRLHDSLEAAEREASTASERLDRLCHAYVQFGLDHPEYYQIMFQLHPQRMERYPVESYRRARRNIERFGAALAAGAADGTLRAPTDAARAADVLWTALHGLVSLHLAERIDRKIAGREFLDAALEQAQAPFRSR